MMSQTLAEEFHSKVARRLARLRQRSNHAAPHTQAFMAADNPVNGICIKSPEKGQPAQTTSKPIYKCFTQITCAAAMFDERYDKALYAIKHPSLSVITRLGSEIAHLKPQTVSPLH